MSKRIKTTDKWRTLERQTLEAITSYGSIHVYSYSQFLNIPKLKWPRIFIVQNMPIKRLWEALGGTVKNTRTEYVLFMRPNHSQEHIKIRIECKFQQEKGTTIDKLLMAIIDLKYFTPPDELFSLIIVDGKECQKRISTITKLATIQIENWKHIKRKTPASLQIFTLEEFKTFLERVWNKT